MPEPAIAAEERREPQLSLFQRLQIGLIAWIASAVVGLIGRTLRMTITFEEGSIGGMDNVYPGIYPFWHRCVLAATWIFRHRDFAVLTSKSRDGEFIARVIRRFGFVPMRGSSSRGGQRGLLEMDSLVKAGGAWRSPSTARAVRATSPRKGPCCWRGPPGVPITAFYVAMEKPGCSKPGTR